jgi:hypothetical protein
VIPSLSHLPDRSALGWIDHFPPHLAKAVRREWLRRRNRPLRPDGQRVGVLDDGREAEANTWLRKLVAMFPAKALELGASEEALVDYAKARAEEGERLRISGADLDTLAAFCQEHGIDAPNGEHEDGIARRVGCSLWWRRNLRRVNARKSEALSITLGQVHRRSALYASHDAVNRRKDQRRRNRALLDALKAINELGQEFTLSELADKGMANPEIRRAELMVRIAGFEYIAVGLEMAGEFVTITAPSRFHPRRAKSGQRNPKYDGLSTPRDTAGYLGKVWSRITAALARAEIRIFGFRVAEPHHDGTPHFHGLFFMEKAHVRPFRRIVARYAVREDRDELGLSYLVTKQAALDAARRFRAEGAHGSLAELAAKINDEATFWSNPPRGVWKGIEARVCFKAIDWSRGTAAGYIAKYIAKNVDGKRTDGSSLGKDFEALGHAPGDGDDGTTRAQDLATDATVTARRVDAWASTWGIRQFQQVGGPPVGVWRELRRWDYQHAEDVLMQAAVAADTGNWARFVEVMGGYEKKRSEMPLTLAKDSEAGINRYGETGQRRLVGVVEADSGQLAVTRMHEWRITRVSGGSGSEATAWTRVNNSTDFKSTLPPAPPATDEDHRRWSEAIEADELRRSIQPLDDGYLPPAALAEQRRRQHEALRRYEHQRSHLSEFMGQIDALVHDVAIQGAAAQEAARQRVTGQALLKQIGGIEIGRGLQVLEQVRTQHEIVRAQRAKPGAARWKAGGSGLSIADQLTQAMQGADAWLVNVNPDPYGTLAIGHA